jgi:hypothetical protein
MIWIEAKYDVRTFSAFATNLNQGNNIQVMHKVPVSITETERKSLFA